MSENDGIDVWGRWVSEGVNDADLNGEARVR